MVLGLKFLLDLLDIKSSYYVAPSRRFAWSKQTVLGVRGKNRLNSWMDKVGMKNPVQLTRYMIWKKYGFVPSKTTLDQRKKILCDELNPYSFYEKV